MAATNLSINVNGITVTIFKRNLKDAIDSCKDFKGAKIHHPFETEKSEESYSFTKRGKTFKKTTSTLVYGSSFISPEIEELFKDPRTVFTVKHDGRCGFIRYDPDTQTFVPYARIDNYRDKTTKQFELTQKMVDEQWLPCEEMPTGLEATHWPHFRPLSADPKCEYKWLCQGFDEFMKSDMMTSGDIQSSFTVEFMGTACNGKKADPFSEKCIVVPHGCLVVNIPVELRTVEGLRDVLIGLPFMEGLVCYCPNNTVYKIRRDMFVDKDESNKLKWPPTDDLSTYHSLGKPFTDGKGISSMVFEN